MEGKCTCTHDCALALVSRHFLLQLGDGQLVLAVVVLLLDQHLVQFVDPPLEALLFQLKHEEIDVPLYYIHNNCRRVHVGSQHNAYSTRVQLLQQRLRLLLLLLLPLPPALFLLGLRAHGVAGVQVVQHMTVVVVAVRLRYPPLALLLGTPAQISEKNKHDLDIETQ